MTTEKMTARELKRFYADSTFKKNYIYDGHDLGVSCGGFTGVVEHLGGVGVKRADAGVNLGECEAKLCHSFLV